MTKAPTPAVAAPDIQSIRATLTARCAMPKDALGVADSAGVTERDLSVPMRDGSHIRARVYSPEAADAGGRKESERLLVVMLHSGEYGCVVVSVKYRKAPENPFPWAASNASSISANPSVGFVVGGTSAGGNMSAAIGLLARDLLLSPPLTGNLLLIPLITNFRAIPARFAPLIASYEQNYDAPILGQETIGTSMENYKPNINSTLFNVLPAGADKEKNAFKGLPLTMFQVCGLDPPRHERLVYGQVLREKAEVKTKRYVYPGVSHGFWGFLSDWDVSRKFVRDTVEGMGWLLGRCRSEG
ncbi:alpha/beta-hydrolase [Cenococcum geophilum 1.58]|uniref:alpha/beta-hydrolase n=1 Tax=Cenococcum geophilum 1.58 TaxID=794803 RepID=UPI00358E5D77|nr:alpha/beta-hydrolase [Cenococcum geophilum 1.58]